MRFAPRVRVVSRVAGRFFSGRGPYEPRAYWESRAPDLIETYDSPETWPERGWMRAGVEERTVPALLIGAGCKTVLVPGAGSGRQYRFLLDAGLLPRGFDISGKLVEECHARFPEVQTWIGDVAEARIHAVPADAVFTSAVLQHVPPDRISGAARTLKALASRMIIVRELTSLSRASPYQFAHNYSELFGECVEVFREVTDANAAARVELIAWRIAA